MGPELRTGLTSAHLVQLAFPALQDLPLLAPLPESSSTQLIVAPEVALTKLPATNGAMAARTDPAPVLSPSQVRCFFDCPARWWFKYGLQLPERKNSSLGKLQSVLDRKSTRLNSSHLVISYAVFCLK